MANIAVVGSAFNPPTIGHQDVIQSLRHFDLIYLLPSIAHPWGKQMLDYTVRCKLVTAFLHDLQMDNAQLCTIEQDLLLQLQSTNDGPQSVTTYMVLDRLQQLHPESRFTFVMGPDNILSINKFDRYQDLLRRFAILTCPEQVQVRSTDIRQQIAQGGAIDDLTTDNVRACINALNLYRATI